MTTTRAATTAPTGFVLGTGSVDDVATAIRHRIQRGALAPGHRLVEAALMADLGVARARIRDALKLLAAEGLVVLTEFRGASVREFSTAEIAQVYEVRELLEGLAARLAARRPATEFAVLQRLQDGLDRFVDVGIAADYFDLNRRWHAEIVRLAGNEQLASALDRLHIPSLRVLFPVFGRPEIIREATLTIHDVTEAITAKKAAQAERLMRRHIRAGLAVVQGQTH